MLTNTNSHLHEKAKFFKTNFPKCLASFPVFLLLLLCGEKPLGEGVQGEEDMARAGGWLSGRALA